MREHSAEVAGGERSAANDPVVLFGMIPKTIWKVPEVIGGTGMSGSAAMFLLVPSLQIQSMGLCSITCEVQFSEYR